MSSRFLWKSLLVAPLLLSAAMVASSTAIAAEAKPSTDVDALLNEVSTASNLTANLGTVDASTASVTASNLQAASQTQAASQAPVAAPSAQIPVQISQAVAQPAASAASSANSAQSLDQVLQYSREATGTSAQAQVTSISQLSDVQPTDWAFQALQSLVERYGCIVGYPDSTYKGSRALTRYEFAAGLNACMDRISELIASSTADLATKEDLATLQRLQEEFAAELATLRGRVDSLEARTAELEAHQFSTTTKLKGETIFAVGIPLDTDSDAFPDDQTIAGYRVRLNFDTSFTGTDLLRARLQARDFDNFFAFGGSNVSSTEWNFSSDTPGNGTTNGLVLDDLYYRFSLGRAQITLGLNAYSDTDLARSVISPFSDGATGSVMNFGEPSQYNFLKGDAGVGLSYQFGSPDSTRHLSLDLAYTSGEPDNPSPGSGLFDGNYSALAQLTYLSKSFDAALTYGNSYRSTSFLGLNGAGDAEVANVYGGQVNFKFGSLQIGGGVAYVPIRRIGVGDYTAWSYQATLALNNFGAEGNTLGILAGITPYAAGVPTELTGAINQSNNFLAEVFYRFNVNDNISVTPSIIYLSAPGNNSDNDSTLVGAIRTSFKF
jgi:Carbohydrate-selective porin, OprB family/S-layer homology domain